MTVTERFNTFIRFALRCFGLSDEIRWDEFYMAPRTPAALAKKKRAFDPKTFLATINLQECSFAGLVDEFVRRVFHARVAQPLGVPLSFLWGHRCAFLHFVVSFQSRIPLRCPVARIRHPTTPT